jgi:flotillin
MNDVAILVAIATGVGMMVLLTVARQFLFICKPHELLVVSGRKHDLPGGKSLNFTVIQAGRHWRLPFLQSVKRMDVRLIPIELQVVRCLSMGGIPLDVHAIANVKITSDPRFVYNAVERFLDLPLENIRTAAKQTLEGLLRGVIAQLTPEQVNQDRIEFANKVLELVGEAFDKMGLHLDTLKVLRVDDEAQYLVNIGRTQIANAIRDAENAESQASQEVTQEEAGARQQAEVASKDAEIGTATKRNELRALIGRLEGEAKSVEREAAAAADQARAEAEQELQEVRQQLETKRLYAEVVLPAEAQRRAAELLAEGQAAQRREIGLANAQILEMMASALQKGGPKVRELFVLSQLDTLVGQVAAKMENVDIGKVQLIDNGDGKALAALAASYPEAVLRVLGSLRELTGVDVASILSNTEAKG